VAIDRRKKMRLILFLVAMLGLLGAKAIILIMEIIILVLACILIMELLGI